jgi:hypothetical protein
VPISGQQERWLEGAEKTGDQMLMRILLVILLSTVTAKHTAAAAIESEDKLSVNLAGVGTKTCAYWLSSQQHKSEGVVWIYGFWSGLNYVAAASQQDQSKATSNATIAAVETVCKREPSRILAAVVWSAYIDLNRQ